MTDPELINAILPAAYKCWTEQHDHPAYIRTVIHELRRIKDEQGRAERQKQDADAQRSIR